MIVVRGHHVPWANPPAASEGAARVGAPAGPRSPVAGPAATQAGPAPDPLAGYTDEQARNDAMRLWDATEGGIWHWGTDENAVFDTLKGKNDAQLDKLRGIFKQQYQRDMETLLLDEMDDDRDDLDHTRALLQGSDNEAETTAVRVHAEVEGVFGDKQRIFGEVEALTPRQRQAFADRYARTYGNAQTGEAAREFVVGDFERRANGLTEDDTARMRALLLPEGGDWTRGDARAAAAEAKRLLDRHDDEGLLKLFEGKSASQVAAIQEQYRLAYCQPGAVTSAAPGGRYASPRFDTRELKARVESWSGKNAQKRWMLHLLEPRPEDPAWQASNDALRIGAALDGENDEGRLRAIFEGKSREEIDLIVAAYDRQHPKESLRVRLHDELGHVDEGEMLHHLSKPSARDGADAMKRWQVTADAWALRRALDGAGTDEDLVRTLLRGRSKDDIAELERAYHDVTDGEHLKAAIEGDFDGREEREMLDFYEHGTVDFKTDPRGAVELAIARQRRGQHHEQATDWSDWKSYLPLAAGPSGLVYMGSRAAGLDPVESLQSFTHSGFTGNFETDGQRLERNLDAAEAALARGDLEQAARLAGFAETDLQTLIGTRDEMAGHAATGAAIVVGTAVTIGSAGTMAPAGVALVAAAAGGTAAGVTYGSLNPQAGNTELGRQVLVNGVASGTGAVRLGPANLIAWGDDAVRVGATRVANEGTAQAATSGGRGTALRFALHDGVWIGAQNGAATGAASTATDDATWSRGFGHGLGLVFTHAAVGAGGGALAGGVIALPLHPFYGRALAGRQASVRDPLPQALAAIDSGQAEVLGTGAGNTVYRVEVGGRRYAVRVGDIEEGRIVAFERAAGLPHTAQRVAHDDEAQAIVMEIVPGTAWADVPYRDRIRVPASDHGQLMDTVLALNARGLSIDPGPGNFLHAPGGFGVVDYGLRPTTRSAADQIIMLGDMLLRRPLRGVDDTLRRGTPEYDAWYRDRVLQNVQVLGRYLDALENRADLLAQVSARHPSFRLDDGLLSDASSRAAAASAPEVQALQARLERLGMGHELGPPGQIDPSTAATVGDTEALPEDLSAWPADTPDAGDGSPLWPVAATAGDDTAMPLWPHTPTVPVLGRFDPPWTESGRLVSGEQLTVGGGRAFRRPAQDEVYLNIDRGAKPHVVGDIRDASQVPDRAFNRVLFEDVDEILYRQTNAAGDVPALTESFRVLRPDGTLVITTGGNAYPHAEQVLQHMRRAGFVDVQAHWEVHPAYADEFSDPTVAFDPETGGMRFTGCRPSEP